MTITHDQHQALKDNWAAASQRLRDLFPDSEVDLTEYYPELASQIAQEQGLGMSDVEGRFGSLAQEFQHVDDPDQVDQVDQVEEIEPVEQVDQVEEVEDQGLTPHTQQPNESDQGPLT